MPKGALFCCCITICHPHHPRPGLSSIGHINFIQDRTEHDSIACSWERETPVARTHHSCTASPRLPPKLGNDCEIHKAQCKCSYRCNTTLKWAYPKCPKLARKNVHFDVKVAVAWGYCEHEVLPPCTDGHCKKVGISQCVTLFFTAK